MTKDATRLYIPRECIYAEYLELCYLQGCWRCYTCNGSMHGVAVICVERAQCSDIDTAVTSRIDRCPLRLLLQACVDSKMQQLVILYSNFLGLYLLFLSTAFRAETAINLCLSLQGTAFRLPANAVCHS